MATPVGHALFGFIVGRAGQLRGRAPDVLMLGLCALVAVAPDLDFLPGLLFDAPARYHQGVTHSLFAALVVGGIGTAVLYRVRGPWWKVWSLLSAAYASHLVLDLFGPDQRPPIGIPLLWPVSDETYLAPVTILRGVSHASSTSTPTDEWLAAIFSVYNVVAVLIEVAVVAPIAAVVELARRGARAR